MTSSNQRRARVAACALTALLPAAAAGCGPKPAGTTTLAQAPESGRWRTHEEIVATFQALMAEATPKSAPLEEAEAQYAQPGEDDLFSGFTELAMQGDHGADEAEEYTLQLTARGAGAYGLDLRAYDSPIKSQGSRSTCSTFAMAAALENLAQQRERALDLSEEHLWYLKTRRNDGQPATATAVRNAYEYWIVPESIWPYSGQSTVQDRTGYGVARSSGYERVQLTQSEVRSALERATPLVIVTSVTASLSRPESGVVDPRGAPVADDIGHAMAVVGQIDDARVGGGGYFIVKNSWGEDWGDAGYGYVPFSFCADKRCEAWRIKGIRLR